MAGDEQSGFPGGIPSVPGELIEKVARAAGDPEEARDVRVRLAVSGGVHGERQEYHCELSGAGELVSDYLSELSGQPRERATTELHEGEFAELLRSLDVSALAKAAKDRPRIPPDSVVGRLEVSDAKQQITVTFMADPEQAKSARYEPPPAVEEAVAAIYRLGAKPLSTQDVRPWSARKG